jgi:hypothetical protein
MPILFGFPKEFLQFDVRSDKVISDVGPPFWADDMPLDIPA